MSDHEDLNDFELLSKTMGSITLAQSKFLPGETAWHYFRDCMEPDKLTVITELLQGSKPLGWICHDDEGRMFFVQTDKLLKKDELTDEFKYRDDFY